MSLHDCQAFFRHDGDILIFSHNTGRLFTQLQLRSTARRGRRRLSTLDPESQSHQSKADSNEHGAGQIGANADEPIGLHEQVEKEALVEMLQQVVQRPEDAFDGPAQSHLVLPALTQRLEGDGIDVVRDEAAVRSRGVAETLSQHAAQHRLQPLLVAVAVVPHALQDGADAHLAARYGDGGIE